MKNKEQTSAQRTRQRERNHSTGRYTKNPCYCCGGPAPIEAYFSHILTDQLGTDGVAWGDTALVLCAKCCDRTSEITTVREFRAYSKAARARRKK